VIFFCSHFSPVILRNFFLSHRIFREIIRCENKLQKPENISTGRYFILKNIFTASSFFSCHRSITYVTHCDFTYIENVIPLLKRWNGPVSVAVYAPGSDFVAAVEAIFYLKYCHEFSFLVRQLATFHLFFDESLLNVTDITHSASKCSDSEQFLKISSNETFKARNNISYPINAARNVARSAATTHFVLVSDIELYPNPNFINEFFEMILYDEGLVNKRK
jgi:hypothetical protein